MGDRVTESSLHTSGARRRDSSYQYFAPRETLCNVSHERHGGLYFTDGHSVNPDTALEARISKAESLQYPIAITAIQSSTKQPVGRHRYL